MKKINSRNYRKRFKEYYGIEFSRDYHVHHIDLNRENNAISNLMLLPSSLHHRYHFYVDTTLLRQGDKPYYRVMDIRICGNQLCEASYALGLYKDLVETLEECAKWYDFKLYMDGLAPNIHGIRVEGINANVQG